MLICNMRKRCEKKEECPHATKHLPMNDCSKKHKALCPPWMHDKSIRCKPFGANIQRTMVKARLEKGKIKEPITTLEAQQALNQLRDLAVVELRMSGRATVDKRNMDMFNIIQGLDSSTVRTLFPNAIARGLDRIQVRAALITESSRQNELHNSRVNKRYYIDKLIQRTTETRMRKVEEARRSLLLDTMRMYYLKFGRKGTRIYHDDSALCDAPLIDCSARRGDSYYNITKPVNMMFRQIKKHLVVIDKADRLENDFYCFALIGAGLKFGFVATQVKDGDFVDDIFKNGISKQPFVNKF